MTLGDWLLILFAVFIGLCFGAGAYSIARSPKFYIELSTELWPLIRGVAIRVALALIQRNKPEDEKKMHEAVRRGEEWDNFRKRPRDK